MQAPMSQKYRKLTNDPESAQKLTEKVLVSKGGKIEVLVDGKIRTLKQIGT